MLFDFMTQKWAKLANFAAAYPNWSKNGKYVYCLHTADDLSIVRVRIGDQKLERVASVRDIRFTGYYGFWLGLTPDDSALVLRDTGNRDVYALNWEAP